MSDHSMSTDDVQDHDSDFPGECYSIYRCKGCREEWCLCYADIEQHPPECPTCGYDLEMVGMESIEDLEGESEDEFFIEDDDEEI